MTNWQHTIDIKEAWEKASNDEITPAQLAAVVAEQLKSLPPDLPDAPAQLAEFEGLAQNAELSDDEFDDAFESLYDWANDNSVWVATFG
jgi:hypothetical protein